MGGLIGREIVQSRIWMDPVAPKPPNLNYKFSYPITVFDAVRARMEDENSETLTEILDKIFNELRNKQTIFPAKSANYIVTYAGIQGGIGSIEISQKIPWDPEDQRHDRIPTEKAVGELLYKLGLTNADGSIDPDGGVRVRWMDVIGRPNIYNELGDNDDGFITQKAITEAIKDINSKLSVDTKDILSNIVSVSDMLKKHLSDFSNPHHVTIEQIGGVSSERFDEHLTADNPHNVTKETIGLGNVDNTADIDKPISKAVQDVINELNVIIDSVGNDVDTLNYIEDIQYDRPSGSLKITYRDGSVEVRNIPIDGLIDELRYDPETKELVLIELSGNITRLDLIDLWVRYTGSVSEHITVEIINSTADKDGDREIGSDRVKYTYDTDGEGSKEADDGELDQETVEYTYDTDGEGSKEADDNEINKDKVQYHWDMNGLGNIDEDEDIMEEGGLKIIRATINPRAITDMEMATASISSRALRDYSVTTPKIDDYAVTSEKIADYAVTAKKIANNTITNSKLAARSIDGRSLFSSHFGNRILVVKEPDSDPIWTTIQDDMLADGIINDRHILKGSIISDKIANRAVTTEKIDSQAVTTEKIANRAITNGKIADNIITGNKLVINPVFTGTPRMTVSPDAKAHSGEMVDAKWVRAFIKTAVIDNNNIEDGAIDGRTLFTSPEPNKALVVYGADSIPTWGLINHEMIGTNAIQNVNIQNLAITSEKIDSNSILQRHLTERIISTEHLNDFIITPEKMAAHETANRVLATVKNDTHPVYTQVNRLMIENNAIGSLQIEDHSVTLSKIKSSEESNRILAVILKNTNPVWTQVTGRMIAKQTITGENIFTSGTKDMVLAVNSPGANPAWLKISSGMIDEKVIERNHIADEAIYSEHIHEKAIESKHIMDWSIKSNNIAPRAIGGSELFTSAIPNRVLAVDGTPYSNPAWLQVTSDMIANEAVTNEKLYRSKYNYKVLGTTEAGIAPEYLSITHQFIVDNTITPSKLMKNFVLYGTPELTTSPELDADNHQLVDTSWVRKYINAVVNGSIGPGGDGSTETNPVPPLVSFEISDHSIDGRKLFTHNEAPRLLGITHPNEDVEFLLVEEDLIANGAVTTNKIQRDVTLLGNPKVEVRPSPLASDSNGGGDLIPDCQWVLDRITSAIDSLIQHPKPEPSIDMAWWITRDEVIDIWDGKYDDNNCLGPEEDEIDPEDVIKIWNEFGVGCKSAGIGELDYQQVKYLYMTYELDDGETEDNDSNENPIIYKSNGWVPKASVVKVWNADGYGCIEAEEGEIPHFSVRNIWNGEDDGSEPYIDEITPDMVIETWNNNGDDTWEEDEWPKDDEDEPTIPGISGEGTELVPGSVSTEYLMDRSVTGAKLFTSAESNRVLAVLDANTDPVYTKITADMLDDRLAISPHKITSSTIDNSILAVVKAGQSPEWGRIDRDFLDDGIINTPKLADNAVTSEKIADYAVTTDKIANFTITERKLVDGSLIDTLRLYDKAVTSDKIADDAVIPSKIPNESITGDKLVKDIEMKGKPTVESNDDIEVRMVRNIIISPNEPHGGQNGDIWLRYI